MFNIKKKLKNWNKTLKNTWLCIKYPFLYPRNRFTDKHYNNRWIYSKCKELRAETERTFNVKVMHKDIVVDNEKKENYCTTTTKYSRSLDSLSVMNDYISIRNVVLYNTITGEHIYNLSTYGIEYKIIDVLIESRLLKYNSQEKGFKTYSIILVTEDEVPRGCKTYFNKMFTIILNRTKARYIKILNFINDKVLAYLHILPTYTELDALDSGWRKRFGIELCQDIKDELLRFGKKSLYDFRITQLKEKWGGLRLYYERAPRESKIDDIIKKYETLSYHTCIDCGEEAIYMSTGYILPLCDKCANATNKEGNKIYNYEKNRYSPYWKVEDFKKDEENEEE